MGPTLQKRDDLARKLASASAMEADLLILVFAAAQRSCSEADMF